MGEGLVDEGAGEILGSESYVERIGVGGSEDQVQLRGIEPVVRRS